jgi:hypothetical protein
LSEALQLPNPHLILLHTVEEIPTLPIYAPYIVSDEIKVGDRLQCVFALVVADQTMFFLPETIA